MTQRTRAGWVFLAFLAPFLAVLALNVSIYYPFISDDALISLRYARRFLDGHGLTWTEGYPVEGYSNLLWVLLVAGLGMTGLDLIVAARTLGLLGVAVAMGALLATGMGTGPLRPVWFPVTVGVLFVALSAPMAVWAIGGLEQPLVGALLAVSIALMYPVLCSEIAEEVRRRRRWGLSGVLGLLAITRPDGALFAVAAAGTFALAGPGQWAARALGAIKLLVLPVLAYGGQALFRYLYYGEIVPNTALVKLTPTAVRRADGVAYLWDGFQALAPFSYIAIAAMVVLLARPDRRGRAIYLVAISTLWSAYLVVIGGDIFPAYRHFVPLIVAMAFGLVELFQVAAPVFRKRPWAMVAMTVITLALFVPFSERQRADRQSRRAVTERWEWQCKDLGVLLKTAFWEEQPLLAVTAAGCLPYWSELPALDMLGLNDYYLPRHPPPDLGTGFLGHELGDGAYVLGRKPDLIVFNVGSEPAYRSGTQMANMAEFSERYIPVAVRVQGLFPAPWVYVDRYSPKIGIAESPSRIVVPGFLFRSERARASLNAMGKLVTFVTNEEPVEVTFATRADPTWTVEVRSPSPHLVVTRVERQNDLTTITMHTSERSPVEVEAVTLTARAVP